MNDQHKNWEAFFDSVPIEPAAQDEHRSQLKARLKDQLNEQANEAFESVPRPHSKLKQIGSILMKYKIPQLAAAAAILIAFSTTFFSSDSKVFALENAIAKLVNAKFARWDMEIDVDGTTSTTRVSITPERTRHDEMDDGSFTIFDWASGKSVVFTSGGKTKMEIDTGTGGMGIQSPDMFRGLQESLKAQLELGVEGVDSIGEREFDGIKLQGFKTGPKDKINIWVNPITESAVRIEILTGIENAEVVVFKNYESGVEFEAGFFDFEQEGYTTVVELAAELPTEEMFIDTLRICCEASGGNFPRGMDTASIADATVELMEHLTDQIEIPDDFTDEQLQEVANGNLEGVLDGGMEKFVKQSTGFVFVQTMGFNKNADAHYAGADVKLNEKDRPIFWYRPQGSENYRVIYADLTVKEMDSAPQVEGAVPLKK